MIEIPTKLTFRVTKVTDSWYQAQCVEVPAIITAGPNWPNLFSLVEDATIMYVRAQLDITLLDGEYEEEQP